MVNEGERIQSEDTFNLEQKQSHLFVFLILLRGGIVIRIASETRGN